MLKKIILVQSLILARHFNLKTGLSQNPNFGHSQFLPSTLDIIVKVKNRTNNISLKSIRFYTGAIAIINAYNIYLKL